MSETSNFEEGSRNRRLHELLGTVASLGDSAITDEGRLNPEAQAYIIAQLLQTEDRGVCDSLDGGRTLEIGVAYYQTRSRRGSEQ